MIRMSAHAERLWVFMGVGGNHPCGVFSSKEKAQAWISKWKVCGTLTAYPLDKSLYEWAVKYGHFTPSLPHHSEPAFVQKFSSAYAEHYHYDDE